MSNKMRKLLDQRVHHRNKKLFKLIDEIMLDEFSNMSQKKTAMRIMGKAMGEEDPPVSEQDINEYIEELQKLREEEEF